MVTVEKRGDQVVLTMSEAQAKHLLWVMEEMARQGKFTGNGGLHSEIFHPLNDALPKP